MKKEITRGSKRYSFCPDPRLEAKAIDDNLPAGEDPGWIEGYLAVFGNVDHSGERIKKGAFRKTLKEKVKSGKCNLMTKHMTYGGDVCDVIGIITAAKEDDYGLFIHADLFPDEDAQRVRGKIAAGMKPGLSVGYRVIQHSYVTEENQRIVDLIELALEEGTVTVRPCNELATVTASKTEGNTDSTDLDDAGLDARLAKIEEHLGLASKATFATPADEGDAPSTEQADADAEFLAMELQVSQYQTMIERIKRT